jgi:three-Cys-motif partner protein
MSTTAHFFEETTEQSVIKAKIVSDYFWAWAKVIISAQQKTGGGRIAYIDLFAGPGRYNDGTKTTPLLVLEKAIKDPAMREVLVTIFNDKDENNSRSLEQAISELPDIDKLKYSPQVQNKEVGQEIVAMFSQMRLVPTLFFIDPWGYKGMTLQLINSVLKDWGCDAIIFFNYNRISMGLSNHAVQEHIIGKYLSGLCKLDHVIVLKAGFETQLRPPRLSIPFRMSALGMTREIRDSLLQCVIEPCHVPSLQSLDNAA